MLTQQNKNPFFFFCKQIILNYWYFLARLFNQFKTWHPKCVYLYWNPSHNTLIFLVTELCIILQWPKKYVTLFDNRRYFYTPFKSVLAICTFGKKRFNRLNTFNRFLNDCQQTIDPDKVIFNISKKITFLPILISLL